MSSEVLCETTLKYLDEMVRQANVVTDESSADWNEVILEQCHAAYCKVAGTFGCIPVLKLLGVGEALIGIAKRLIPSRV